MGFIPLPKSMLCNKYIYIYIVEEGLDGHGLLLLRVSRVMRSAYMALNTLQQDWLL